MNIGRFNLPPWPKATLKQCLALAIVTGAVGCASVSHSGGSATSASSAHNVYQAFSSLPAHVQRVAVLPVAGDWTQASMVEGIETLEPLLVSELIKTRKFEVVRSTPHETRLLIGNPHWTTADKLPAHLPTAFESRFNCDAILFCELTVFRPYPPLAVGWRMKLVDLRTLNILWAGDEVFDAGQPGVLKHATRYQREEHNTPHGSWAMERSPGKFGQYAASQMLATLPAR